MNRAGSGSWAAGERLVVSGRGVVVGGRGVGRGERPGVWVMSGVLDRAAGFFVAPAAQSPADEAVPAPAARAVVLGRAADAVPLAAAIARSPRPGGLVAIWPSDDPPRRAVATRAAARLAARLAARELRAVARGRLAWLAVPPDPAAAVVSVRRASALVDGPLVTALCGPRPPELDGLVAEHDLAVVAAPPDTPLARAAVARLAAAGVPAHACAPLPRGLMRTLALAGLAGPRRRDVTAEDGPR